MIDHNHSLSIIIAGDTAPIHSNLDLFSAGSDGWMDSFIRARIQSADAFIVNLECPLSDHSTPRTKAGWVLRAPASCAAGLAAAGVTAVNLANNHAMDQSSRGLFDTLECLQSVGIGAFGAGESRDLAGQPFQLRMRGLSVAFLGMTTGEAGTAGTNRPGVMPMDIEHFLPAFQSAREDSDHVVILLHAGLERYPYPSPGLQSFCRFLIDQGASAVLCQHSHCIGSEETWNNGYILYGQGNFVFDWGSALDGCWNSGLMTHLRLTRGEKTNVMHIPTEQTFPGVRVMPEEAARHVLITLADRSRRISDSGFIEEQWMRYVAACSEDYRYVLTSRFRLIRKLIRRLGWSRRVLGSDRESWLRAIVMNRDHREIIQALLDREEKTV
ncbi:CapA family protein [bacterium]|nr:CapA family protein [candidate division CSSED10-310 bacterium]